MLDVSPVRDGRVAREAAMRCKICGGPTRHLFDLPALKATGGPLVPVDDDGRIAAFHRCEDCAFLFTPAMDEASATLYESNFSGVTYHPEEGSELQYLRLVHLAAGLLDRSAERCRILDFGCGVGHFTRHARRHLGLEVEGFDTARQAEPVPFIHATLPAPGYDVVVAREVVEHFTDPIASFRAMAGLLRPGGVLAFQTSLYEPDEHGRDWGYIGPRNGHISLFSAAALDRVAAAVGAVRRITNGYGGIQAWQIGGAVPRVDHFVIRATDLAVKPGGRRDGAVITEAAADARGHLCFGPHRSLPAGRWRVVVLGDMVGRYRLLVHARGGKQRLGVGTVSAACPALDVTLAEDALDLECVIARRPDSDRIRLEGFALHRLADAVPPVGRGPLGAALHAAGGWVHWLGRALRG